MLGIEIEEDMEAVNFKKLVNHYKSCFNQNMTTINDLITKEMDGEPLSCNQFQAIQNFYLQKIQLVKMAKNETAFSENTYVLRLAANFIPYKEFV